MELLREEKQISQQIYTYYINHPLEDNQATWYKKFPCEYLYKRWFINLGKETWKQVIRIIVVWKTRQNIFKKKWLDFLAFKHSSTWARLFSSFKTYLQFLNQFSIIPPIIKSYSNSWFKTGFWNVFTWKSQIISNILDIKRICRFDAFVEICRISRLKIGFLCRTSWRTSRVWTPWTHHSL